MFMNLSSELLPLGSAPHRFRFAAAAAAGAPSPIPPAETQVSVPPPSRIWYHFGQPAPTSSYIPPHNETSMSIMNGINL